MKKILILYLLLLAPDKLWAQTSHEFTLPEIVLIGIEPDNSSISLELDSPTEAGSMNLSKTLTAAKRIVYTSALPELSTRKITAEKKTGTIPAGTKFYLVVSGSSSGSGVLGTALGEVEIPQSGSVEIISDIGSSFTGIGEGAGHAIDYKLEVTNMSALRTSDSGNITITFTILDNL